jgi:hypothetical protein
MSKRNRSGVNRPQDNLESVLSALQVSDPGEGFADRVMGRVHEKKRSPGLMTSHHSFPLEWKNGLVAAVATLVFVASDMPQRIVSLDAIRVGTFIQVKVLTAVELGIHWIASI